MTNIIKPILDVIKPISCKISLILASRKVLKYGLVFAGFVGLAAMLGLLTPKTMNADLEFPVYTAVKIVKNGHLTVCKLDKDAYETVKNLKMVITAYSSSWYETTGIPGVPGIITASGKHVADGIIASNILPFGTKVRIPSLYGNKVFIVEDRMNARYNGKQRADIWMPSHTEAKVFGVKTANVEIVES